MKNLYLIFLKIAEGIQKRSLRKLDPSHILLLNAIAVNFASGNPLTVSQTMNLEHIASPTTVHRKLEELRLAGFIEQIYVGTNRRTKYLVPTPMAHAYFGKMAQAMVMAGTPFPSVQGGIRRTVSKR